MQILRVYMNCTTVCSNGASRFLDMSPSPSTACCRNLDYEIVIIDDNSPDGTQEVVKRLQTAYSSEKIVMPELDIISE